MRQPPRAARVEGPHHEPSVRAGHAGHLGHDLRRVGDEPSRVLATVASKLRAENGSRCASPWTRRPPTRRRASASMRGSRPKASDHRSLCLKWASTAKGSRPRLCRTRSRSQLPQGARPHLQTLSWLGTDPQPVLLDRHFAPMPDPPGAPEGSSRDRLPRKSHHLHRRRCRRPAPRNKRYEGGKLKRVARWTSPTRSSPGRRRRRLRAATCPPTPPPRTTAVRLAISHLLRSDDLGSLGRPLGLLLLGRAANPSARRSTVIPPASRQLLQQPISAPLAESERIIRSRL